MSMYLILKKQNTGLEILTDIYAFRNENDLNAKQWANSEMNYGTAIPYG